MNFFDKIKKVITNPTKFFNAIKKEKDIGPAFIYYMIFLAITSVFSILYFWRIFSELPAEITPVGGSVISTGTMISSAVISQFIFGIILIFIVYGIIHLLVKLVKGKGNFSDTFKAMVYGATPNFLISPLLLIYMGIVGIGNLFLLIPVYLISIAVFIWVLVIQIKGIKILHKISTWRAVLAILILPILLVIIIALLFVLIIMAIMGIII